MTERSFEELRAAIEQEVAARDAHLSEIQEHEGSALVVLEQSAESETRELYRVRWVRRSAAETDLWWSYLGEARQSDER